MAALAAEGLAIHQPPIKIISGTTADEIDDHQIVKGLDGLETACASVQELPKVGIIDDGDLSLAHKHSNARDIGIEELQIQENEPEVPRLTKNLRQASCYISLYISGYNCGVTGTLLPTIEKVYKLNYATVSLLFVSFCIGYLFSAFGSGRLIRRFGFGKVLTGAGVLMMLGIIINCSQLVSFPLMCFAFLIVGTGFSTQLGLSNSYFATLPRPLLRMGVLHGLYGFGAFTSPLIATLFISRDIRLNLFYLTSLGLIVPSILVSYFAFVHGAARYNKLPDEIVVVVEDNASTKRESLREIITRWEVWILSLFLLFYVGAEESIGGWIVSYMTIVRHGDASGSAWVASGFYLGIAVGRVCLPFLNLIVGERLIVLIYILLAAGLQAVSWAVNSFMATAISTALVGLTISTFYTAAIHTASKLLPRRMHTTAMTMMSSIGQSGSAIFPFVIGLISNKKGIWTVQPAVVALLVGQFICWNLVPKVARRVE